MLRSRHHLDAHPLRAMTPNRPVRDARLQSNRPALLTTRSSLPATSAAFTIVEVMMASVILVVGFMGMISALTVGSEMVATARRQTIANQIITNELERLRLESWTTISALTSSTTWSSGSVVYPVGGTVRYEGGWYRCLVAHTSSTTVTPLTPNYWAPDMTYLATTTYVRGDVVYYVPSGTTGYWYRYINTTAASGVLPTNTSNWSLYSGAVPSTGIMDGVTFTMTRNVVDVTTSPTDLREVTFLVSWTKSGTNAASSGANNATSQTLSQLAFLRDSPISRTYIRRGVAYFGKYGLNNSIQRS